MPEEESILRTFLGTTCKACENAKPKNTAFCRICYYSLPNHIRQALWRRFDEGFEDAYTIAFGWLKATDAQHQPTPVRYSEE